MSSGIFLIKGEELIEMSEEQYVSEDYFQSLLEKYPNLLAGNQIDSVSPRRWLFINREAGVPDSEDSGNRWYIDHLFLDQDGIPTLVEVKRSTDTRIRREVVGQMLDYASNVTSYWPIERIKMMFEETCQEEGVDPETSLGSFIGVNKTTDEFWTSVDTNIKAGKLRLLFVADTIPSELQRIIEFLNKQMDPAEVLGVEIKQYVGDGETTLVPRVIGQTVEAQQHKKRTSGKSIQWNEDSYLDWHKEHFAEPVLETAKAILNWVKEHSDSIWWGKGRTETSYIACMQGEGRNKLFARLVGAPKSAYLQLQFAELKKYQDFSDETIRMYYLCKFNEIEGVNISEDKVDKYPSIGFDILTDKYRRNQVLSVIKEMMNR